MKIRKMGIEDYEGVLKIWNEGSIIGMRNLDDSYEGILKFLNRNPNTNFVAEIENKIVGVILSGHDGRRGYIYHMGVKGKERRNGIGKQLVEKALDALREEGINKVALVAFKSNDLGNQFWESMGFIQREDLIYRNKSINESNI